MAVIAVACSRVQPIDHQGAEIRFQVAGSGVVQTRAPGMLDNSISFGAYAWYKGDNPADDAVFMENRKVSWYSEGGYWTTIETAYYWPRGGGLDFICYSPYSDSGNPEITENAITYSSWNVETNPDTDIMYSDKSPGLREDKFTYYYTGVPVLFRHALSKVAFDIELAYDEATPDTGDKTRWMVKVKDATIRNVRTTGSLALSLDGTSWQLPPGNVWTPEPAIRDYSIDCSSLPLFTNTDRKELGSLGLVLPQALDLGQTLALTLDIYTYRDTGGGYPDEPFLTESDVGVQVPLHTAALPAWGINQSIHYYIKLTPSTADENLAPVEVRFDPAVSDWETVNVNAEIHL